MNITKGEYMKTKLTIEEMEKIKFLFDCAVSASSKQEASTYINRLRLIGNDLTASAKNMYSEMLASTQYAAGRVSDKTSRVNNARHLLLKLELFCVD